MSLVLVISKDSISSDGTTMTIVDSTGDYNVTTNPGGYGTPNPDRADIAIILRAFAKRISEDDIELDIASYDPENATEWEITLNKDGWQQIEAYGLRLYSVDTEFSIGELTYNAATDEIFKILTKSGSGPYTYTYDVVTIDEVDEDDVTTAYSYVLNTLVLSLSDICLYKSIKKYYDDLDITVKTNPCEDSNFGNYLKIDTYLKTIAYDFAAGNYSNAQESVEQVENLCNCFTESCGC